MRLVKFSRPSSIKSAMDKVVLRVILLMFDRDDEIREVVNANDYRSTSRTRSWLSF